MAPVTPPPAPTASPAVRRFRLPQYTQIPNELLDELMPTLSGAQFKVMCYIARRTFGFHREEDAISFKQIATGTGRGDGGTGLSRRAVIDAVQGLVERGLVCAKSKGGGEKGTWESNTYCILMQDEGKGQAGAPNSPPSAKIALGQNGAPSEIPALGEAVNLVQNLHQLNKERKKAAVRKKAAAVAAGQQIFKLRPDSISYREAVYAVRKAARECLSLLIDFDTAYRITLMIRQSAVGAGMDSPDVFRSFLIERGVGLRRSEAGAGLLITVLRGWLDAATTAPVVVPLTEGIPPAGPTCQLCNDSGVDWGDTQPGAVTVENIRHLGGFTQCCTCAVGKKTAEWYRNMTQT